MKVLSVINHKGGVGKTTLAANVGAGLAARGKKILLIDLEPQASLTFSFMSQVEWRRDLATNRTLLQWLSPPTGGLSPALSDMISTPTRASAALAGSLGQLDLIASHSDLANPDAALVRALNTPDRNTTPANFVRAYWRLTEALHTSSFSSYDVIVLDCGPGFNVMSGNAILASDYLLVPVQPDEFSYNGVHELTKLVREMIQQYNECARDLRNQESVMPAFPPAFAVAFNKVTYWGDKPKRPQGTHISRIRELGVPAFETIVRERRASHSAALADKTPVILLRKGHAEAAREIDQLVEEVALWIEGAQP